MCSPLQGRRDRGRKSKEIDEDREVEIDDREDNHAVQRATITGIILVYKTLGIESL